MKKVMRTVILSTLALCLSVACKNYTANIEDYLSYWSTEAAITGYKFDPTTQTDAEGMHCAPSKTAVTVTFTLRNPKNFHFRMPGDSGAPADIITFPQTQNTSGKRAAPIPQFGKDYEFKKISNTKLALTYTPAFLQKYEWGSEAITPAITLYTNDGRVFKQTIPFELTVNTPPPAIKKCVIAQTKTASSTETSYYVLCLQLSDDDMKERCSNGLLHEDIAGIEINETTYRLSVDGAQKQLNVQDDSPFIGKDKVTQLAPPDAENIPSDWTLYLKTDVKAMPGSAKKDYTMRLKDAKGLYSKSVTARTQLNEPQQAQAAVITGTKIASLSGNGTTQERAIVIKAAASVPEAQIKLSVPDEDVTIHYTLTEVGHTPGAEQTGTSPVTVDMPLNEAGEKVYTLTYHTDGVAFKPSASITVYYKVLKEHTVTFDSKGGSAVPAQKILHGSKISPKPAVPTAPSGYTFRNWCINEACTTAWDFDSGVVTSDITLYARWDPVGGVSYRVDHYQQNINDDNYPPAPTAIETLSGTAGTPTTATANNYAGFEPLPFEQKRITADGNTVVKVYYNRKRITVTFKLAGGNISGSTTDVLKKGKFGAPFTAPVPTRQGYTFTDWTPALPSPLTFPAANATYTARWQEISKPSMRIKEGISAEEKSYKESGPDDLVLDAEHYTNTEPLIIYKESGQAKLSITSSSSDTTAYYQIDAGGWTEGTEISLPADGNAHKLTVWAKKGADDSIKTVLYVQVKDALTTYKELKNVVKHANDGAVIMVKNIIAASSSASGNNGEIVINKNITIQGTNKNSEILDAGSLSRIFRVTDGKTLTIKDITLTKGDTKNEQGDKNGGGVYIENGSCTMDNVLVVECTADAGGAVYVNEGTFSISGDTRITPSEGADEQTAGKNDVYLKNGKFITVNSTLNGTIPIARITPERYPTSSMPTITVLWGSTVNTQYSKFTVTDETPAKKWKINASGNLEAVGGQSPAIVATSWEDLRTKVQSAADGTVIEIAQNLTYNIAVAVGKNSTITVNKNITIKSKGSGTYTLNAGGKGADSKQSNTKSTGIFEVSGNKTLTLENLILTKTEKYAVYVAENNSLTMKNVTIKDCKTDYNAAGIYFRKGKDLTLENCTIEKCKGTITANLASGGIDIEEPTGTVSLKETEIKNCEVTGTQSTGGGIHLYKGTCTLTNVIIQECKAPKGGGMCVNAGTLTITGGSFTKNKATGTGTNIQGGAIYSEGGRLTLDGCSIGGDNSDDGNTAKKGGGIYLKNVALTMQNVTVKNNKASTQGGGIYLADGELKIPAGNTIADNSATDNTASTHSSEAGGGIYVEKGMLTLDGGIISGNSANANTGGGVHLKAGTFTMNSGEIKNCSAKYGGGVSLAGKSSFTMKGGSITGCKAVVEGGVGGGIYTAVNTKLTLEGTDSSNPVVIANCTAEKAGGGMLIYTKKPVTVKNAHIKGNTAENGGGVYLDKGAFTIADSTRITPSTEATAGQNDVFLEEGMFIKIGGTLTAESPIARITPKKYGNGVKVLEVSSNDYTKFTVTPNGTETWSIQSDGTLKEP